MIMSLVQNLLFKMKKIFFVTVLFVGTTGLSFGQVAFSVGIKGGPNFATIEGENLDEVYSNRTGYHAGAFISLKATKFGIQPEVIFSSQGSTIELSQEGLLRFNYINIPVMVKFYPVSFLNFQVGPQFGFLTSAEEVIAGIEADVSSLYKDSDLTMALGFGLELPFGLNLDARYNLGVSDINDDPAQNALIKNQVYQVSLGFRFVDLGK